MRDTVSQDVAPALSVPWGQMETAFRRLSNGVGDMTQEALDYRGPGGDLNSTAMLLFHLAWIDLGYLHIIMGVPIPPELAAAYGPDEDENGQIRVVAGRPAADLLDQYRRVIDIGREYFKTRADDEASRPVTISWWPEPATVRYVLWHMAGHSMHHQGQISRLKAWYSQQGSA